MTANEDANLSAYAIRPTHSKCLLASAEHMSWSNRMDLMVVSNDRGEVAVYRLNLNRVWLHPPPAAHVRVRGVEWRPDEKIIAIAYSTGLVVLVDIEKPNEQHVLNLHADVSCIRWTPNAKRDGDPCANIENPVLDHRVFLEPLPNLNSLTSSVRKNDYNMTTLQYSKQSMNVLIVATRDASVTLYAYGVMPIGTVNVAGTVANRADDLRILDARLSSDFRQLIVTVLHVIERRVELVTYRNEALSEHRWSLLDLAVRHGYILNALLYVEDILLCITEAWETAQLEVDKKMMKYANSRPPGSLSVELLELLMFGTASVSLQHFFVKEVQQKGLRKLFSSIDVSYLTIQKLVVKPLQSAIINITYHLSALRGMSRNLYYYQKLLGGAYEKNALQCCGAFLIKSMEMQQTIEQSTRDYRLFWCWLSKEILRIMNETIPDDIPNLNQQDTIYLANFLNDFDSSVEAPLTNKDERKPGEEPKTRLKRFNLERVGQYLEAAPLTIQSEAVLTQSWHELVEQNECLRHSDLIYPHDRDRSLTQCHDMLKDAIAELFIRPQTKIGEHFAEANIFDAARLSAETIEGDLHLRSAHVNNERLRCAFNAQLLGSGEMLFVQTMLDHAPGSLGFDQRSVVLSWSKASRDDGAVAAGSLQFRDIAFYNEDHLAVLLHIDADARLPGDEAEPQTGCPPSPNGWINVPVAQVLAMMPTATTGEDLPTLSMFDVCDLQTVRRIERGDVFRMAVSGRRKLVTVLSNRGRRVRVYETEVDEDDDDDECADGSVEGASADSSESSALEESTFDAEMLSE